MSGLTNYAENAVLDWLLDTGNATMYVALHTVDPGEDASGAEVTTGEYAGYARKVVTMAAAANGQSASSSAVTCVFDSGTECTVTHASIWDALSGGNCLIKGPLTVSKALGSGVTLTFEIGELIAELD